MDYVWTAFNEVAQTRQVGMAANPLTFLELEAYERKALNPLPAWETALVMRLDRVVRTAWAEEAANDKPEGEGLVSVNDRKGVRGLLSGISQRLGRKRG